MLDNLSLRRTPWSAPDADLFAPVQHFPIDSQISGLSQTGHPIPEEHTDYWNFFQCRPQSGGA